MEKLLFYWNAAVKFEYFISMLVFITLVFCSNVILLAWLGYESDVILSVSLLKKNFFCHFMNSKLDFLTFFIVQIYQNSTLATKISFLKICLYRIKLIWSQVHPLLNNTNHSICLKIAKQYLPNVENTIEPLSFFVNYISDKTYQRDENQRKTEAES